MHHRQNMSCDQHPQLLDVTAVTENIAVSIVACCIAFTELLPGNALIKSVTVLSFSLRVDLRSGLHLPGILTKTWPIYLMCHHSASFIRLPSFIFGGIFRTYLFLILLLPAFS
jgi:hypothetical protein